MRFSISTGCGYPEAIEYRADQLPADLQAIGDEAFRALLDARAAGKVIVAGENGEPVATDPPAPTAEQLLTSLRGERNRLLAASDWTQLADVPEATRVAWAAYRQALRDLPAATDPANPAWPSQPPPAAVAA